MVKNNGNPYRTGEVVVAPPGRFLVFNPENNEVADFGDASRLNETQTEQVMTKAGSTRMANDETVTEQIMTKSEARLTNNETVTEQMMTKTGDE
jgi:hypothetical protein